MPRQILVCNDEPHVVRAISLKFTRAEFEVKSLSDALSCWQYLDSHPLPGLAIVDFSMPRGPAATDLVRRIRSDQRMANLPVFVLMSEGVASIDQAEVLRSLAVSQVFSKPFSPREVLAKVIQLLGHESSVHSPHFESVLSACYG